MPPMITKSTSCSDSTRRISSGSKTRSGGATECARLLPRERDLGREAVEAQAGGQPLLGRHGALSHQIVEVIPTGKPLRVEHRFLAHCREDRAEARPGDVLVSSLDPRDGGLARPRSMSEFALGEAMFGPECFDEFRRRH